MKIDKILAGIDLGDDTGKVLAYASFFAGNLGASLHALHVIDFLVTPPAYLSGYMEQEKKGVEKNFEIWNKKLRDIGVAAVMEVAVGRLHESFESAVRRLNAGMFVLGFRSHALRRSSSEKLIKGLEMPILVVRGERAKTATIGSLKIRKVLCPVDFSKVSEKALDNAREIAGIFSSELDVVHVLPSHVIRERITSGRDRARVTQELLEQAGTELHNFLGNAGIEKEGVIEEGEPHEKISSFASQMGYDLIIMGARGHSYIEGMLIGSVTDAVLKSSPCPVLLIH